MIGRHGAASILADTAAENVDDLRQAVSAFQRSESWFALQPIARRLLGQYSFGLGVVYGVGENVITSVVELLQLAKILLLADLCDRAHQSVLSSVVNPIVLLQRLLADASMGVFRGQLEEAHREREALIEELRYAMTHLGEVVGNVKEVYVAKWNRFEALAQDRTVSSQFQAGRMFGEVLIEVISVIGGGTAAVRAAGKIPKLAKLARLKIPAKSAVSVRPTTGAAVTREGTATPSRVHPAAPAAESPPKAAALRKDVYVLDKEGVPVGARKGKAREGLPEQTLSKEGWPDLPGEVARNFNSAEAVTLRPGTTLYRIIDDASNPAGSYWTENLPASRAAWRSDYAVKPGWNSNGRYVEYTVPEGSSLNVWRGETAAQELMGSDFHLPGGAPQIWMPPGTAIPGPARPTGW